MKERLWRFVYENPPWSVIVTDAVKNGSRGAPLPLPDRIIDLGVWNIEGAQLTRADEDAS